MHADIVELRAFYSTLTGRLAERAIATALSLNWTPMADERLVGLGYCLPWLERFGPDAERVLAFMPAGQGAVKWPAEGPCATALVFEEDLPLADSSIDRLLMVHALEFAENPRETLKEAWRVLSPGGRLVAVVPNRRGFWSRSERTPFGAGRPYSRGQMIALLREAGFTPTGFAEALFFPPVSRRSILGAFALIERAGRRFWPLFAGVNIVVAEKRLYQGVPARVRSSRRVFAPVLSPQGAGRTPLA